jgi:hypothetical protein
VHVVTVRDRLAHAKVILSEFGSKYLMSRVALRSWKRQIVEASVEGFGGGIWWRKIVEALVEGSGGGECLGDTTIEFSPTQHFGNVRTLCSDDAHMCGEINERKESGA